MLSEKEAQDLYEAAKIKAKADEDARAEAYEAKRKKDLAEEKAAHDAQHAERHANTKFASGDVTEARCGGPKMVVEGVRLDGGGVDHKEPSVLCSWFDINGHLQQHNFVDAALADPKKDGTP